MAAISTEHELMWRLAACLFVATGSGCTDEGANLFVDLRTDFVPELEFQQVRTTLTTRPGMPALLVDHDVDPAEGYFSGHRVADFADIAAGSVSLLVALVKDNGSVVAERTAVVEIRDDLAATVVITRTCLGILCPGPGDDPGAVTCLGGRCVAPDCSGEHPELCGAGECAFDTDCVGYPACVAVRCELSTCLAAPMDASCEDGEVCDRKAGCLPGVSSSPDASRPTLDAGLDAAEGSVEPSAIPCADEFLGMRTGIEVATGNTVGRGDDYSRCLGAGAPDVAFGWIAPAAGSYRISTCGSAFDTVLTVLDSSCTGAQRACADDGCGVSSSVTLTGAAHGDAFVIIVDGLGESGAFHLAIEPL